MEQAQESTCNFLMRQSPYRTAFLFLVLMLQVACSTTPYKSQPLYQADVSNRAVIQEQGQIRVSAAVPSIAEAERIFGIPLKDRDIQPVWLEVENKTDSRVRFAPYSLDASYFPPHEVAYMYRKSFSKQGWLDMERNFSEMSMPRYILPGQTLSGYVFTNTVRGTKAFNVDIFKTKGKAEYEHFTFFIDVPDFKPDHSEVDFKNLYAADEINDVDIDGLRTAIGNLPCCTTDQASVGAGKPVELFLVAKGRDLLQALLRAGWSETSYEMSANYLNSSDYYFKRPPDAIFRKGRNKTTERNEMGVWMLPYRVNGTPLWAAQVKHAIGRRFAIEEQFLGVQLDPDINDGRNYMLQDMWYSQSLLAFAWSSTGRFVARETPELDFKQREWFSDGLKLVLWISGETIGLNETKPIQWDTIERTARAKQ